jgi:hypothetical protein
MWMRKDASSTSGALNFYAKTFWKNTNGTNALLGARLESADPTGLDRLRRRDRRQRLGDDDEPPDRAGWRHASTAANVPGTDLASGAAIGDLAQMTLATEQRRDPLDAHAAARRIGEGGEHMRVVDVGYVGDGTYEDARTLVEKQLTKHEVIGSVASITIDDPDTHPVLS